MKDTTNKEIEDFFHIKNWPKQLTLSNLQDGNSFKVINNFQLYSPTLIGYKKFVAQQIYLTQM